MATEALVSTVVSMLGTSLKEGAGLLVVGIDYDDLSPAVGASVSIDLARDDPWVLSSSGAASGARFPPMAWAWWHSPMSSLATSQ